VDPHHIDAQPGADTTYHFDVYPDADPDFYLMRIRLFTMMRIWMRI
jgi:hypothetical protein